MNSLVEYIKSDLARVSQKTDLISFFKEYFFPKGDMFRYDVWFRIVCYFKQKRITKYTIGMIAYLILRHYEFKYGIHADTNVEVGKGLKIVHGDGIHLKVSKIGDNFTVLQGVTLGNHEGGCPKVGNNVTIYPNAVVVGEITLGDGCTIGANAYVDKDIPPKSGSCRGTSENN